jgi:hypothetical protein
MSCPAVRAWWCVLIAIACLFLAPRAKADSVSLAVAGANGISAGADTLTLQPSSGTLNLPTDGSVVTTPIQLVTWSVGNSGTLDQDFPLSISELVTLGGVSHVVAIEGDLLITPTGDFLTLAQSAPVVFDNGTMHVTFAQLGLPTISTSSFGSAFGDHTISLSGTFQAEPGTVPTPEPSALMLLSTSAIALFSTAKRKFGR